MARRVEWTEVALDDVEHAAAYIARDSARYAAALVREALSLAATLGSLAERGRMVPEFGHPDVRELPVHSYRLVYQVTPDVVRILGLIHGARDLPYVWRRDARPGSETL